CISRRKTRRSAFFSAVTFTPLNHTSPEVGSMSRRMHRPGDAFPQRSPPPQPQGFAGVEIKAPVIARWDPLHRAGKDAAADDEMLHQIFHAQHRFGHGAFGPYKTHATLWAAAISRSGGTASRQAARANGQRGANRQPGTGWTGLGTTPAIDSRRDLWVAARSIRGIDRISPCVLG